MQKTFNFQGPCDALKHYMLPLAMHLEQGILRNIERNQYFLLHGAPKSGKSTVFRTLAKQLNESGNYVALCFSLKAPELENHTLESVSAAMLAIIYRNSQQDLAEVYRPVAPTKKDSLLWGHYVANWTRSLSKPLILLIDDIDQLEGEALSVVTSNIRSGFTMRPQHFPICIGLSLSKDHRAHFRGLRVPFNIIDTTYHLEPFSEEEVKSLLGQHGEISGQFFPEAVAKALYKFSKGNPELVNFLANNIISDLHQNDASSPITMDDLAEAIPNSIVWLAQTHGTDLAASVTNFYNEKLKEKGELN